MWGPYARDVLQAVTEDDVSAAAFPFARGRSLGVGGAQVWAQRITYVGELGYELYAEPAWGMQVWDRLAAAGARHGLRPSATACSTRCAWRRATAPSAAI